MLFQKIRIHFPFLLHRSGSLTNSRKYSGMPILEPKTMFRFSEITDMIRKFWGRPGFTIL